MNKEVQLFSLKKECCGCGACTNICPRQAIHMEEDKEGFVYPVIDEAKCVQCGLCKTVCNYQNEHELHKPQSVYVMVNKDQNQVKKSASGGAFAALATSVLVNGGVVYGAAYERFEDDLKVVQTRITELSELHRLQGSKYVQSMTNFAYQDVKKDLLKNRVVLFSGTPCQVDGLKGYLKKDYENLITVDIVCHGVPNQKFFNGYIHLLEKKCGGKIESFNFRDKEKGWGDFYIQYGFKKNGRSKQKRIHCRVSSYYELFLTPVVYRENCYSCKYAGEKRTSDITIGDYWGIEHVHKELFFEKKWRNRRYTGISCVLANSLKGIELIKRLNDMVELVESSYDKAAALNGQLKEPSKQPEQREEILKLFSESGYEAVESKFKRELGNKVYLDKLKCMIPMGLKKEIREGIYIVKNR